MVVAKNEEETSYYTTNLHCSYNGASRRFKGSTTQECPTKVMLCGIKNIKGRQIILLVIYITESGKVQRVYTVGMTSRCEYCVVFI